MGSRYQVKIAGQGFLIRPGSYRRAASSPYSAPSTQHSEPSLGWRQWSQSSWQGGDGQETWDGETGRGGDGGTRWRTGYGVDIDEQGRVRLGPILSAAYISTEDGFAAMLVFQGKLYAIPTSSGGIYTYDGAGWGVDHDTGKASLSSLARFGSRLYAGSGSDGSVFQGDGSSWSAAFQVADANSVSCMASYGAWDPAAGATVPRLFLGCHFPGSEGRVYRWDGSALAEVYRCQESRIEAIAVYGGRLYLATSDAGNGVQGRILRFDGGSASGEWSEVVWLSDNYVAGWATFDNLLFCGSGAGGRVWAFDGNRLVEAYRPLGSALEYSEPLRALGVCASKLYVGYSHPTQGVALLSKLPLAGTGGVGDRATGGRELELSRQGWCTPCTAGAGGNARSLAVYGGCLYLAGEAAGGAAAIYRKEPDSYRSIALLETSFFDGGQPGIPKLLHSFTLSHDKLLAGHSMEVRFALDGSDSFQQVEEFDSLAGCDRDLTTADWRTGDSLVRLKGMPRLGFAGKRRGDPAVAHGARKLAATGPNTPPATFVEEFDDAEYAAISTSDGNAAVTANPAGVGYAHQLFEFDLAGLNPAGLRPRAICYGLGNSFGVPAPGVLFNIWNHASGAWDLLGSHQALPGDSVAARTLEATIANWGCYAGPSGKLYLSLHSSYSGSASNPSEVGTDLVEIGALWAGSGEVTSEPLRLPVAESISSATLTLLSSSVPDGTGIELYLSADGGVHWEAVGGGVEHDFAHPGSSLRWKAILSSANGQSTPQIDRLKVDYFTGSWLLLGRSDTEGSMGATFSFQSGVVAGRVAFRIEMESADPSSSPGLAGITLRYAFQPETKRRWEMDLICEGAAGAPLRLLDGSHEEKSGGELSQALWQARARGAVPFEDLEGSSYQVWFEGLEERLSDAAQERGVQTVARCRLTEC